MIEQYLALKSIKGISDNSINSLIIKKGSLDGVFNMDSEMLNNAGFSSNQISSIKRYSVDKTFVKKELEKIKKYKIRMILLEDDLYPALLKEINSPPAYLYTYGDISALYNPSIAVVGARKCSKSAKEFAFDLSFELAEIGFNIVSGFAAGIDINAHLGAINKGYTTAVFGNGLLKVYPGYNKKYVKDILKNGCIISEFPLEEEPLANNFPKRNRIISGLSLGVIVVEASEKSGSLITARYAVENNREVFAVPAWPKNHNSGTNKLIKNGAKLTENYMDVVEEFARFVNFPKMVDNKDDDYNINFDSDEEKEIYNILKTEPLSIDEICMHSGKNAPTVLTTLSGMELKGMVQYDMNGKYSVRRI